MDKRALRITKLVTGIFAGFTAIFFLISGIINIANVGNYSGFAVATVIILFLFYLALAAADGFFTYKIIKAVIDDSDTDLEMKWITSTLFSLPIVISILAFINFGINATFYWVLLVFAVIGLIFSIVSTKTKGDDVLKTIFALTTGGLGFITTILLLCNLGGVPFVAQLFALFFFVAFVCYYVFDLIILYSKNSSKAEPKKEVEAETKEETTKEAE